MCELHIRTEVVKSDANLIILKGLQLSNGLVSSLLLPGCHTGFGLPWSHLLDFPAGIGMQVHVIVLSVLFESPPLRFASPEIRRYLCRLIIQQGLNTILKLHLNIYIFN